MIILVKRIIECLPTIALAVAAVLPSWVQAQTSHRTMDSLFVEMPDTLMPLLSRNNRMDCIDFLSGGMRAVVTNRLDEKSELLTITPDFMELVPTGSSRLTARRLLMPDGSAAVCIVHTVYSPRPYSRISLYDTSWKPLSGLPTAATDALWAEIKLSADNTRLIIVEEREAATPSDDEIEIKYMATTTEYEWEAGRFVLIAK